MARATDQHSSQSSAMPPAADELVYKLVWLGPTEGDCGTLLQRINATCGHVGRNMQVQHDLTSLARVDRVVIACERRVDYPWQTIELLERSDSGVPWGVVTGSWYSGSRRTGIGPVTHWQLPWYRWWEAWYGWFFPELVRRGARCATQFDSLTLPIDLATPSETVAPLLHESATATATAERSRSQRKILIVANCWQTLQAWQLSAARAGWSSVADASCVGSKICPAGDATEPECILWDDSCVDRLPGGDSRLEQACRQISQLREECSSAPIVAAVSLGHLSGWTQLERAGASDFIVKPSFGLPLADYLTARDRAS